MLLWRRYADDTFVVQHQLHKEVFQHINTVGPSIPFTEEEGRPDGFIPFLNILVTPQTNGTFTTKVHRKPTHTDLYLQWDSHHNLTAKYSVISTLTHRVRIICYTPQLLTSELQHLEKVLRQYKYPKWAINKVLQKQQHQQKDTTNKRHTSSGQPTKKKCHIIVPYSQGICESFKTICHKYRVQVHFKGGTTLKNLLVSPKDKYTITKKSSVIYWFKCDKIDCEGE